MRIILYQISEEVSQRKLTIFILRRKSPLAGDTMEACLVSEGESPVVASLLTYSDTPVELTATCMLHGNARILMKTATRMGLTQEARKWEDLMNQVRRDFMAAYCRQDEKSVAPGSPCALAMALYFHLVPEQDREAVLANLVRNPETNQFRQNTGELSFRFLLLTLAEGGRPDVVYRIIHRTDPPGYGRMLTIHGLKTLSECRDKPGSSLNHCMFGHAQEWFQKYLLGIRQEPGSIGCPAHSQTSSGTTFQDHPET